MRRWTITRPALLVLAGAVAAVVIIPILRKMTLPASAFHLATASVVVHSRAKVAPTKLNFGVSAGSSFHVEVSSIGSELWLRTHSAQEFLPILYSSLRL
jgi:hypothetical protein